MRNRLVAKIAGCIQFKPSSCDYKNLANMTKGEVEGMRIVFGTLQDIICGLVWFGLWFFNVTFNNISAISWRSVLLVEETGVPGVNHRPVASY
jgi:hypothetical protein